MSEIKLMQGDCLELIKDIPDGSVDMLLSDLPYGTTRCKWDSPLDLKEFWQQVNRVVKENGCMALFAQTPFDKILGCSNIKNLRYEWIWEKTEATGYLNAHKMPMKAHENILVFYRKLPTYNPQKTTGHIRKVSSAAHKRNCRKSDCYGDHGLASYDSTERFPRSVLRGATDKRKKNGTVAQKPVWLCEKMILTYTNEGETVLDCCMGSGSIGVACLNTGRKFIGMELDKRRFNTAVFRLAEAEKAVTG